MNLINYLKLPAMGKYLKYKLIGLALIVISMVSCDMVETAEQDASPIISPDNYPVATYTASATGTSFTEGQVLTYTIKLDKMIDRALTFSIHQTGGTALAEEDFTVAESVVMQPYTKEVKIEIAFIADDFPEGEETLQLEIGIMGIAEKNLVNPSTVNPMNLDLKIVNKNDAAKLTLVFEWPDHDMDYDIVTWSDTPENPMTEWGDGGASGKNPERDKSIEVTDPDGTYYVNVMDWDEAAFTYKFSIGHPTGTNQFIEGTFDRTTTTYINDIWTAWGDEYDSFRVLKVVKSGSNFTVTKL